MSLQIEPELSENALRTLRARYLRKGPDGRILETPGQMFRRVAAAVAQGELHYGGDEAVAEAEEQFYEAMVRTIFLPNSPTLMNAGRKLGVLSACFVLPVADSIEAIFESVKLTAQIQKAGGGTGFSFDRLRPTGDYIASSGGSTSGPISFLRVFSEATSAIQQGAFRRGANMGMLAVDHPDILKFIEAKNKPGVFQNFNLSVKVGEEFMRALREQPDRPHVVVNPRNGQRFYLPEGVSVPHMTVRDLQAADGSPRGPVWTVGRLWRQLVENAWAGGEPGVCFIDRVNEDNPTPALGRIEATNPCGEQPLLDYEACNLGSVDLAKFVRDGRLDEEGFRAAIRLGVRFLDDVIEVNNYVDQAITTSCKGNRKIGLGVMGFADAMFELGVPYGGEECLTWARRVAHVLREEAVAASEELGERRGSFPNYPSSTWASRGRAMRNAAVTTVAPTGTLSILASTTGGIEPAFALAYRRHVLEGQEMIEVDGSLRRFAERHGFWSEELAERLAAGVPLSEAAGVDERTRRLFVTAHEVPPEQHVQVQAAFQDFIDGAISKTINLPAEATVEDVDRVYRLAFELGCKGVTVYRHGCREGEPMTLGEATTQSCPQCQTPLAMAAGCSRCPNCGATICV